MRSLKSLIFSIFFTFISTSAFAQTGLFIRNGACSDITSPVEGQTYCINTVIQQLTVWHNGAYVPISGSGNGTAASPPVVVQVPNANSTGTFLHTFTKITGAPSTAVIATTADSTAIFGITVGGAGTSGSAFIQLSGITSCVFDGATTAGDYVTKSSTVNGNCHDNGLTPAPLGVTTQVLTTNSGAGTYQVLLSGGSGSGASSGGIGLNVVSYGADPTGVSDSAAAIQATILAACTGQANTVYFPPGQYQMSYPMWPDCNGIVIAGNSPTDSSTLLPVYDFGYTGVVVGSNYPSIPTVAPLVGSTGNSFDFTQAQNKYWINLRDFDGLNGPLNTPSGATLNRLSAFSAEAFVKDVNAGDGEILSSGSQLYASLGELNAFQLRIEAGDWQCLLATTHGTYVATGGAASTGTVYYVGCTYDGANLRLYVCTPGQSSCPVAGTTAVTGEIVQSPSDDVTVGPQLGIGWPNGAVNEGAINGYIYSPRLSDNARFTGSTITAPSIAFTSDSNTLILTNGEKAPSGIPFFKGYDSVGAYGFGWLFGYNTTNVAGDLTGARIQNLSIYPAHSTDVAGFILDGTHQSFVNNISLGQSGDSGGESILSFWNLAYQNWAANLYQIGDYGAGGRYGIVNNSNTNSFENAWIGWDWACEVSDGNALFTNVLCTQGQNNTSAYGLAVPAGGSPTIIIKGAFDDAEIGSNPFTSIFASGSANITADGQLGSEDGAPILLLDQGPTVTITGALLYGYNNAMQIVQTSGTTPSNVTFTNPTLTGFSGTPITISTTLTYSLSNAAGSASYTPSAYLSTNSNISPVTPCTALTNHQHLVTTDANTSCSAGTTPVGGGTIRCDVYCYVPGS